MAMEHMEYNFECQETVEVATDESSEDEMVVESRKTSTRRGQPFPPATVAALRAYHTRGMVGVGKKYEAMIDEASKETNLSEDQIKV